VIHVQINRTILRSPRSALFKTDLPRHTDQADKNSILAALLYKLPQRTLLMQPIIQHVVATQI
jgi:hypothetical protein